jgi:hypothetical protein
MSGCAVSCTHSGSWQKEPSAKSAKARTSPLFEAFSSGTPYLESCRASGVRPDLTVLTAQERSSIRGYQGPFPPQPVLRTRRSGGPRCIAHGTVYLDSTFLPGFLVYSHPVWRTGGTAGNRPALRWGLLRNSRPVATCSPRKLPTETRRPQPKPRIAVACGPVAPSPIYLNRVPILTPAA